MKTAVTKYTQNEFQIRMFWGMIVGFIVTALLGYPTVITIPLTAMLICWSNRGLRGSVEYIGFRLRIQLIFIIVDMLAWYGLAYLLPQVPAWQRFMFLSCILIAFWLQIYYRFKIMPLNLTAVFSTLIFLSGLMVTSDYGYKRMFWNVFGLLVGCVAAYIWPRASKLEVVQAQLQQISRSAAVELDRLVEKSSSPDEYGALMPTITTEMTTIQAYLVVVQKDHTKATNFPMRLLPMGMFTFKYKKYRKEIPVIMKLSGSVTALTALIQYLRASKAVLDKMSEPQYCAFAEAVQGVIQAHLGAIEGAAANQESLDAVKKLHPETDQEIVLLDLVLRYQGAVAALCKAI